MTTSEQINELAAALATAQSKMVMATKDATNPHYRSTYATLASVRDACRPLADHGLAIVQGCRTEIGADGTMRAIVDTRLIHTSGQWIGDELAVPVSKSDAQGCASAMTYARRIGLAGLVGLAPADDDGEAAVGHAPAVAPKPAPKPDGYDDWSADIVAVADEGTKALRAAMDKARAQTPDYFAYLTQTETARWSALKAKAAKVTP